MSRSSSLWEKLEILRLVEYKLMWFMYAHFLSESEVYGRN